MQRLVVLVDGFNLYHALDNLHRPQLKWLDLWCLGQHLSHPKSEELTAVYYFSAFANWLPDKAARHRVYVNALKARGVTIVLGKFKVKDRTCPSCWHHWQGHEEKETDVNIAIAMLRLAQKDQFDRCILLSRDSDLAPAIRATRADYPLKTVTVASLPYRGHSGELVQAANDKRTLNVGNLTACLLPKIVLDATGAISATRPTEYD